MIAKNRTVGLGDISFYFPENKIELTTILEERCKADPAQRRRLERAIESTGQKAIRFPSNHEDTVTMAANAAQNLLDNQSKESIAHIRYLASGTETSVDHSKPVASYIQGMLKRNNPELPTNCSIFQVQHACAAASIATMGVAAQLALSSRDNEKGIVIASDIARYEAPSTAEITQGAGAVALLIETDPGLLAIDIANQGFSSADVDDFFRPLGSITAKVRGQYSMQCYHDAANTAFLDHCQRLGKSPASVLNDTDWFVFHVPFARMAYTAARSLLTQHLAIQDGEVDEYLADKGFFEALETTANVGNIYTGASFLNLASLLENRYKVLGQDIIGKKILFSSYGSGNTMLVFSATVCAGAPERIARWNLPAHLNNCKTVDFNSYQCWLNRGDDGCGSFVDTQSIPKGSYYLDSIREDGYRVYQRQN